MAKSHVLLLLLSTVTHCAAVLTVAPGSSCAQVCQDVSGASNISSVASTNGSDIVCHDHEFRTLQTGKTFKSCIECLQSSDQNDFAESDLHWYLYNLRYALGTCLFSYPSALTSHANPPCNIDQSCGSVKAAILNDNLQATKSQTWDYCDNDSNSMSRQSVEKCFKCLGSSSDFVFLSNFLYALQQACNQMPAPGDLLSLNSSVFSNETLASTGSDTGSGSSPTDSGQSPLTTGTIVGIVVGVSAIIICAMILWFIYWRRSRYPKDASPTYHYQHYGSPQSRYPPLTKMSEPLHSYSEQSYRGDDDELGHPNTSGQYYDQLETQSHHVNYNFDPRSHNRGAYGALPTHQAYIPMARSRTAQSQSQSQSQSDTQDQPGGHHHRHTQSDPHNPYPLDEALDSNNTHSQRTNVALPSLLPTPPLPPTTQRGTHQASRSMTNNTTLPGHPPLQAKHNDIPSLTVPRMVKIRTPKRYSPPSLRGVLGKASGGGERRTAGLQISRPVITSHDGNDITEQQARVVRDVADIPLRSGKSDLYGF